MLPDPAPAFLDVHRTLVLGDDWRLFTRVTRVAPQEGAIHASIPLWPGEQVTTARLAVEDDAVQVSLSGRQRSFNWSSVIQPTGKLALHAADQQSWAETWRVQADNRWHIDHEGLVPVVEGQGRQPGVNTWKPWPGERLELHILRPEAVSGPTLTIDSAELSHQPGQRSRESVLELVLRSSQGGDYVFKLPGGAELQGLTLDGVAQLLPQQRDRVRIPLHPGTLQAQVTWRRIAEPGWLTHTPTPDLGMDAAILGAVAIALRQTSDWLFVHRRE